MSRPDGLLRIDHTRPAAAEEWDAAWEGCEYATYFQSREWAEIWAHCTSGRLQAVPLHVSFSDGLTAIVPMSKEAAYLGLVPRYVMSPAGTFGGWLSESILTPGHAELLQQLLVGRHGTIRWRLNPYDDAVRSLTFRTYVVDETHAVDLTGGYDSVYARWRKGQRSNIRKAERAGVSVCTAFGREAWQAYFATYEESLARWGESATSRHPWRLFERLYKVNSPRVRLWLAVLSGEVVAGALCFYGPQHVAYWAGAARAEAFPARPVNLLLATAIRDACDLGYRWFDFNPSGGHQGVAAFKRTFGAEPLPCPVVTVQSAGARVVQAGMRTLRVG